MPCAKETVYQVLRDIPHGHVATYGQIAELAGLGRAARFVGSTLKSLPEDSTLPWHRVINSQGKLSLRSGSPAYQQQVARLRDEGIRVEGGRVALSQHRWVPG